MIFYNSINHKEDGGGYSPYGGRISTLAARFGAISITYPLTLYGREIFLNNFIPHRYLGLSTAIIAPSSAFLFCFFAQFFDYHLTNASNWVATGAPVGSHKLLRCFGIDENNHRRDLLEIDNRLEIAKKIVRKMPLDQWEILYDELKQLGILHPDESEQLLSAQNDTL